ncbi:MAG: bifunctional nuclease family protein [Candidatus Omnitrophica bacterium]|jgi:bifunctional DNase/RNase|nr:bifunctional nuclease family protein [Candidatus Omnitrophota bacterium]
MVKVEIYGLALNLNTHVPIIILRDKKGNILPIVIGVFEAQAIVLALEKTKFFRPLTHDLFKNIIEILESRILKLEIYQLKNSTYFANLVLKFHNKKIKIDCRPSDGIAIALRTKVPIYAAKEILEPADIINYYENEEFINSEKFTKPINEKEMEEFKKTLDKMTAQNFWESLNTK